MKKCILTIALLIIVLCSSACDREHVDTLMYAVFPYKPDIEYYQEIIEARWAELEPDIRLVRANWDCYYDGGSRRYDSFVCTGWQTSVSHVSQK